MRSVLAGLCSDDVWTEWHKTPLASCEGQPPQHSQADRCIGIGGEQECRGSGAGDRKKIIEWSRRCSQRPASGLSSVPITTEAWPGVDHRCAPVPTLWLTTRCWLSWETGKLYWRREMTAGIGFPGPSDPSCG